MAILGALSILSATVRDLTYPEILLPTNTMRLLDPQREQSAEPRTTYAHLRHSSRSAHPLAKHSVEGTSLPSPAYRALLDLPQGTA